MWAEVTPVMAVSRAPKEKSLNKRLVEGNKRFHEMSKIGATVEIFQHLPIDKVGAENLRQSLCYHAHHLTKAKDVHCLPEFFLNIFAKHIG